MRHRLPIAGILQCLLFVAACSTGEPGSDSIEREAHGQADAQSVPSPTEHRPLALLSLVRQQNSERMTGVFLGQLETVLREDPSLLAGRLRVSRTEDSAVERRVWFRPDVSTSLSQGLDGKPAAAVEFRQELFDFGKRAEQSRALLARADFERVELDGMRLELAGRMMMHLVDAQEARLLIALNTRRKRSFAQAVERAQSLADLNMVTAADLSLAEVKLQEADRDLASAQIALSRANRGWAQLSGGAGAIPDGVSAQQLLGAFGLQSIAMAQSTSHDQNLDLRIAKARADRLRAELTAGQAESRPTINIVGTTRLDDNFSGDRTSVGLSVDYALLSRDRDQRLRDQRDAVEFSALEIADLRRRTEFDVADAWAEMGEQARLAGLDRRSLAALRERVELLEAQLPSGLTPFDQVIDAKLELFATEASALRNRFAAERAAVQLLLLTGVVVATRKPSL